MSDITTTTPTLMNVAPFTYKLLNDVRLLVTIHPTVVGTVTVDIRGDSGETTTTTLTEAAAGKLVQVTHMAKPKLAICYLPTSSVHDITGYPGKNTILICKDGTYANPDGNLQAMYVTDDVLAVLPHQDATLSVIPAAMIDREGSSVVIDPATYMVTFTPPPSEDDTVLPTSLPYSMAIYKPVDDEAGVYCVLAEGHDSLEFTDLAPGYLVAISYQVGGVFKTEYAKVPVAR